MDKSKLSVAFVTGEVKHYYLSSDDLVALIQKLGCVCVAPNTYRVEDLTELNKAYNELHN